MNLSGRISKQFWIQAQYRLRLERSIEAMRTVLRAAGAIFSRDNQMTHIHCFNQAAHNDSDGSLSIYPDEWGFVTFHCFGCEAHGDIYDVFKITDELPFDAAVGETLKAIAEAGINPQVTQPSKQSRARNLEGEALKAQLCAANLAKRADALAYIYQRRGISADTAARWCIGVTELRRGENGKIASATWTIPVVSAAGQLVGIKLHRDPPVNGKPKCRWLVRGYRELFPPLEQQSLKPDDTIILCPGELKALVYLDAGLPATSPTTGETTRWTSEMAQRFAGLRVKIDPDRENSAAARQFVLNASHALAATARSLEVLK